MKRKTIFIACLLVCCASQGYAKEYVLRNGDRISGTKTGETESAIIVETEAMGAVTIEKSFLKPEKKAEEVKEDQDVQWSRKATLGYSKTGGNTQDSQGAAEIKISRKTKKDEWSAAWKAFLSTANEEMDAKKFYAMGRYGHSYGKDLKWYNFYKFESEQDYFANIEYRLVPSAGIGYWFADKDDWKLMAEAGVGFEHTHYRDNTESDNKAILIPRGYLEKVLLDDLRLTEDLVLYPSISGGGEYRLHTETSLINPLSDRVAWKVSFIDDYNSDPSANTKKNDYRLITSLDYSF